MHGRKALGLGPTTFFASRERCRLPEALLLADAMRRLAAVPCSLSLRAGGRFIISSAESTGGARTEEDVVEVADYDPARNTVLAIGLKEPSPDVAIHWLAYRTDETAGAAAFVWDAAVRKGVTYSAGKHPWGSFDEAMALLSTARGSSGPAGLEGRGYLVRGRGVDGLLGTLAGLARLKTRKTGGKGQGARGKGRGAGSGERGAGTGRRPSSTAPRSPLPAPRPAPRRPRGSRG
ncbi:MAG: hypothetical protein FJ149_09000 [Euryarchaeota archaeon]|nr:hypothetical protein [Euryarchaeota archaeon]